MQGGIVKAANDYKAALFDLGGVLVELTGVPRMMELTAHRYTVPQLWKKWITSPVIRLYESGKMSTEAFGEAIVREFEMAIEPAQYLKEFTLWPARKYPGVDELLEELKGKVVLASLSNTNALHWERVVNEMNFIHLFDYNFPSHETRLLKPDVETFLHAAKVIGVDAKEIVFFDDNEMNVEGAKNAGLDAVRVKGLEEARLQLKLRGLLEND